jgi:hypothetical protein
MKRVALMVGALAVAAPVMAQDASGTWDVTVTTSSSQNPAILVLKKDGEALSGNIRRPTTEAVPVSGTQKAADIVLSFTIQTQNGPLALTMRGRQDGEAMKGTIDLGREGQADWTAARTKAPAAAPAATSAVDLTGTWALQVVTDNGTRTPTVVIKQDGDKITGQYKSQIGEAPIAGKIKGNEFSFQVTLSFEGNSFTIVYTGTADQNEMKGRVDVADLGGGTFTGKKQDTSGR